MLRCPVGMVDSLFVLEPNRHDSESCGIFKFKTRLQFLYCSLVGKDLKKVISEWETIFSYITAVGKVTHFMAVAVVCF